MYVCEYICIYIHTYIYNYMCTHTLKISLAGVAHLLAHGWLLEIPRTCCRRVSCYVRMSHVT